jgi:hypothetical protein
VKLLLKLIDGIVDIVVFKITVINGWPEDMMVCVVGENEKP